MNVPDSSAWIEYLRGGARADVLAPAIENVNALLVPTVCLAEVYGHALRHLGSDDAVRIAAAMLQGRLVGLTREICLSAAELGVERRLTMVDSIVVATARTYRATLWSQEAHLTSVAGVRVRPAPPAG